MSRFSLLHARRGVSRRPLRHEPLEPRQLLAVVISEFMADNESTISDVDGEYNDWIEIRNTAGSVNLEGWFLTDDTENLLKWRFPSVDLSAGAHKIIFASNKDRTDFGSELHTNFKLSNDGEYLALVRPDGTIEQEFAPEYPEQSDDISYGLSSDLAEVGYFIPATPGTLNIGSPLADPSQDIVITEVMYHPASEDSREEFIEIHNRGARAVDLIGWQIANGVSFSFPDVTLNAGEYLVVAADEAVFQTTYPGVDNVVGGWSGQLSNRGERIELHDSSGKRIDRVAYADQGDWATRIQVVDGGEAGWDWYAEHDGGDDSGNSRSLELVNLSVPNDSGQNWASSNSNGGTPGAVNSTNDANTAPIISNVENSPIIPRSTDAVVITADVSDDLSDPRVQLVYRVGESEFVTVAMNDAGINGDDIAIDGTYSMTLPPVADGVIVEFYISATDGSGNLRTWPAADTGGEQSANALYQVNDEYDPMELWQPGEPPRFYQIMRPADREDFLSSGFNSQSDAQKNASFVIWDGTGVDVRHTSGIRIRGSASRSNAIKSNRINFPTDNPWHGLVSLNINAPNTVNQISGSALWRLGGLPVADASAVRMYSNGTDLKNGGVYNYLETPNSDMAANQFAGDSNGNFYRGRRSNESPPGGMSAGLAYLGPISTPAPEPPNNPYASYAKITNSGEADWSDVAELTYRLNDCGTDGVFRQCVLGEYPEDYVTRVEEVANIDQWLRTLAMSAMLDNSENGLFIGDSRGDDYMMYSGIDDPRFLFVMHDLDSLYRNATRGFNRFNGVPALNRLVNHPDVLPRYFAQLEDLAALLVSDSADTTLDEVLRGVTSQGQIDSIKAFLDARAAFVLSRIPQQLTVTTELPTVGDYPRTITAALDLSGTVPAAETRSVLVNGQLISNLPGDGTWTLDSTNSGNAVSVVYPLQIGSDWSYLDDGTDQGTAWREPAFNDASWAEGPAPLGFNEGDEATLIGFVDIDPATPDVQRNATTYFRSEFDVADPSLVRELNLLMQYDDAAIVYINGVEALVTSGLESGADHDTYSTVLRGMNVENVYEYFQLPDAARESLVVGQNIIAVEMHQNAPSSPDLSFDARIELAVEDPNVQVDASGVILNPGINRVVVEAFDGPHGNGERIGKEFIDVWYDGPAVDQHVELSEVDVHQLALSARDSYLPGIPSLVRVSALDFAGQIEKDLWDAEVYLTVDNPNIQLSTDRVSLVNGQGSALVEFRLDPTQGGSEDFTLTAWYQGKSISKPMESLSGVAQREVGGAQVESIENWSGVIRVTEPYVVSDSQMLNILPGTIVLLDGDPVGVEDSVGIEVSGAINALGTTDRPVTFTASAATEVWGQISIQGGSGSFDNTIITRAGNAPGRGHTGTAAAILMGDNADVAFRHGSITDLRGKSLYSTSGNLIVSDSLFSRSVMGPEIQSTALQFTDSWILAMAGVHHPDGTVDDNDGIYLHDQRAGQVIALRGGVLAGTQDDGIDTLGSDVTVDDYIVRDIFDKGVSQFRGEVIIRDSLIVNADIGVNTKGTGTNTPHTVIDRTTIAKVNTGIFAEDKGAPDPDVVVTFDVSNSVIRANEGGNAVATDYDPSDIFVEYSNVSEAWPGIGNTTEDPGFINPDVGNFYPSPGAVTINAGTPGIIEADGTRVDQGYYGEGFTGDFRTDRMLAETTIASDVVLAPYNGPFVVSGEVVVAPGARLIVLPGTSVFFDEGAELVVEGELIAQGSKYQRIRFTANPNNPHVPNQPSGSLGLPDGPPRWLGIHFSDSRSEVNRVAYADVEYAESANGSVGVLNSNALIDNITVAGTHLRMVYGTNVSMIVQNSVFPNMFAAEESPDALGLDNISEHIKVTGRPPEGGQFIIRNNVFGTNKGHNDVIDADSARLPNPILQVRDNVFMGAGDEELDLGGDVYVSGNLFTNIFKDDETSDRGYANAISTGDAGTGTTIAVARNFFIDVDHAINLKRDTATIFENNSVYKIHGDFDDRFGNPNVGGAINLFVDEPGATSGLGAYVEANVVWDAPRLFSNPDLPDGTISELQVENNLLDPQVADNQIGNRIGTLLNLGLGNIVDSGRFVELSNGKLALDVGSAGIGAGPLGQDMGANIREGIWIRGEPGITASTTATFTVGGPGIFAYRYRVDGGDWSADIPIGNGFDPINGTVRSGQITLTDLAPGPHQLEVLGQDFAGVWQAKPTISQPWVVDANHASIRINEVLASNAGAIQRFDTTPDYIELYNAGTVPFDLSGIGLSDEVSNPDKYVFPSGTIVPTGGYLVVYADGESNPGLHAGFKLSSSGEGVFLDGGALDSVEFGVQLDDLSIGRTGGDARWTLNQPTPGFTNVAQRTGDPRRLSINEWYANGDVRLAEDFIELFNSDDLPVDFGDLFISDHPNPLPNQHAFTPLSFIAAHGHTKLVADGNDDAGADHLNFQLSADREHIGLFDPQLNAIDRVLYFAQTTDVTQGRIPDGAPGYAFDILPTPGLANEQATGEVETIASIAWDDVWAYEDSGVALPSGWKTSGFDDAGWSMGPGLLGVEAEPLPRPLMTELAIGSSTYYFRKTFELSGDLSAVDATFSTAIDDGAVVYVNGVEVQRVGMPDGLIEFDTLASRSVNEAAIEGLFTIPNELLVQGTNVIAVEVHQRSINSGDIVFGLQMDATQTVQTSSGNNAAMRDLLDGLRVTEIMFNGSDEYLELTNVSDVALQLKGVRLEGAVEFAFPDVTLDPGQSTVVADDLHALINDYGNGINAAGQYSGDLSNGGEEIVLRLPKPFDAAILRFDYEDDWYVQTDGGGQALELVSPTPIYPLFGQAESWQPTVTGGSPGFDGVAPPPSIGVVINEILAHTDLPQFDAIELRNISDVPIEIGGWYLSDAAGNPSKFQIPIGTVLPPATTVVYDELDFNPTFGFGANDFALDSAGDDVYLWKAHADGSLDRVIDYAAFGATANGESFGRVPGSDGRLSTLIHPSFGCQENSPASVGSVLVSEVNFGPASPNAAALAIDPTITADDLEFIEVYNSKSSPADLAGWRLRGGVEFGFANESVAPDDVIVVVSFDPRNATRSRAFRAHYGIGVETRIVGGYAGQLDDSSDGFVLQRPDASPVEDPDFVPYVTEDTIEYTTEVPPVGTSLNRRWVTTFGGQSGAWRTKSATPGVADFRADGFADLSGDGILDVDDIHVFQYVLQSEEQHFSFDGDADGDVDLHDLEIYLSGGFGRLLGDADLDGNVDANDYAMLRSNLFEMIPCARWSSADFNGDGLVDGSDFNIWNSNKFQPVAAAAVRQEARPPQAALPSEVAALEDDGYVHSISVMSAGQPSDAKRTEMRGMARVNVSDGHTSNQSVSRRATLRVARRHESPNDAFWEQDNESIDDLFSNLDAWL